MYINEVGIERRRSEKVPPHPEVGFGCMVHGACLRKNLTLLHNIIGLKIQSLPKIRRLVASNTETSLVHYLHHKLEHDC
eukprot:jgi/Bigna1/59330/fgenesh1_kg.4_\